jgi:RNA 2',3'-cyclic 3'-phosphodiesterase
MQEETLRLFLAVPLSEEVRRALTNHITRRLQKSLPFHKWVHPSDLHITLHFLGDVNTKQAEQLKAKLTETVWSVPEFSLSIQGFGSFGPPKAPQILWAALGGELDLLGKLQEQVVAMTAQLGFPKEERAYKPHVTIARKYRGSSPYDPRWVDDLGGLPDTASLSWMVTHFHLYQSHLGREPMYEVLGSARIGKS